MRKSRGGGHGGAYVPAALKAALARASAQGKRLGRKPCAAPASRFEAVAHRSLREAAKRLGVSRSVVH